MRRVMDLPGWIPAPAGATTRGGTFPTAEQVVIDEVQRVSDTHVDFSGISNSGSVTFHFPMPDKNTAEKVATILKNNNGKGLLSIAFLQIPEDQN